MLVAFLVFLLLVYAEINIFPAIILITIAVLLF